MHQFNDIKQFSFARGLQNHKKNAEFAQLVWESIAPEHLLTLTNAICIRENTLYISTEHNAVAAKVKMLMPDLINHLSKLNANVTGIQVKVQVKSILPVNSPVKRKLSKNAASHLKQAASDLEGTALADSLAKLAKNAEK